MTLDQWSAAQLRVSLFVGQNSDDPSNWWQEASGKEPSAINRDLRSKTVEFVGTLQDGVALVLRVAEGRIDWVVAPEIGDGILSGAPTIAAYEDAKQIMLTAIKNWFDKHSTTAPDRMAFGGAVLAKAASREASYAELGRLLAGKVTIDPKNSSDFSYRINRPRKSITDTTITINRLSTWVCQSVTIPPPLTPTGTIVFNTKVDWDINTTPDGPPISSPAKLLNEMVALADEIIEKGDIA